MGKREQKGVVFPIDWKTSGPDPSLFQIPKPSNKKKLIKITKPSSWDTSTEHSSSCGSRSKDGQALKGSYERENGALILTGVDYPPNACLSDAERTDSTSHQRESPQWNPDIYVHAFVPEAFSAINQSPTLFINTPAIEGIDFASYISSFAGSRFLSVLEVPMYPKLSETLSVASMASLDQLNTNNYGQYFKDCLVLDMKAQIPEIRSYDLFGVRLEIKDLTQQLYTLRVPGLREGTPSVSFGDSIMLRQLILDPATNLPQGMSNWLIPGGGFERGEQAPGFTGYEISAVVVGVDKIREVLSIRAYGLLLNGTSVCNVTFVVQARVIQSLQRAVADVETELNQKQDLLRGMHSPGKIANGSFDKEDHLLTAPFLQANDYAIGMPERIGQSSRLKSAKGPVPVVETSTMARSLSHNVTSRNWLQRMLFPEKANGVLQRTLPSAAFPQSLFDKHLNYEQKKAVDAVHSRNYGDFCYLVNGGPGSGKTKVLCEITAQLGKDPTFSGSILLCAPSDPAADTLALRLRAQFEPKALLRLNHFSRTFAEVPQELLPYCCVERDVFNLPPMPSLMAYKIIVTTCQSADLLIQARVTNRDLMSLKDSIAKILQSDMSRAPNGLHWGAVLIDEAAQATEPESLIPLTVLSPPVRLPYSPSPIFAMAGDQHQLSPRTYQNCTTLHVSLFERLSNTSVYASHPLARKNLHRIAHKTEMLRPPFVNLTRNYRSHPAILAVPSSLFYANTLIPEATHTESLQPWSGWRGRRWPVLFACNSGIDDCEDIRSAGSGWYNLREAKKAIAYAQDLLTTELIINQSEICIMSPFPSQVNHLRKLARQSKMWGVNIGPMVAFQGLESRFVIICTTRARRRFLEEDRVRGMGIVNEKKKFNVAMTRAKEGLIVLGNPWVLTTDPCWLAFLKFCWRNSLWQGEDGAYVPNGCFEEANVNEWPPAQDPGVIHGNHSMDTSGLEAALIYKERDKAGGSRAVKRFMDGSESQEDALWRSGVEAEESIGATPSRA